MTSSQHQRPNMLNRIKISSIKVAEILNETTYLCRVQDWSAYVVK